MIVSFTVAGAVSELLKQITLCFDALISRFTQNTDM